MNKINQLFDEQFVKELFSKKILPLYPEFEKVKRVKIKPHKKGIWGKHYYHVVLEFETSFLTKQGKIKKLPIFCSAHDSEPRRNVYIVLKYLWENGFSNGFLSVPHPLFYSKYFKAVFYRGVKGNNIYHYIKENDREKLNEIIPKVALWFAKLHRLSTENAKNFNKKNSRIKTVIPGLPSIIKKISEEYPKYLYIYEKAYDYFNKKENKYLNNPGNFHCLIHGDAHPENIIRMGKKKVGVIDFADLSLADPARDIGSFLQQLNYMAIKKIGDQKYINKLKKIFLETYLKNAKIKMTNNFSDRIDMYYNWTSLRTATHLLLMEPPRPKQAEELIKEVKRKLKIRKYEN